VAHRRIGGAFDEFSFFVDTSPSPLPARMVHVFEFCVFLSQKHSRYALREDPSVIKLSLDL